jgi:hypothetical protein
VEIAKGFTLTTFTFYSFTSSDNSANNALGTVPDMRYHPGRENSARRYLRTQDEGWRQLGRYVGK